MTKAAQDRYSARWADVEHILWGARNSTVSPSRGTNKFSMQA